MKIWALFSFYDDDEISTDNSLDAWWQEKPSAAVLLKTLRSIFSTWEGFTLPQFLSPILAGEEVNINGFWFQLKQIEEGKI
jgi:hypothetical protein